VTGMALNSVRHPVMRLNIGSNVFSSKVSAWNLVFSQSRCWFEFVS